MNNLNHTNAASQARKQALAESAEIFASAGFTAADVEPFAAAEDAGAWPDQRPVFRELADTMPAPREAEPELEAGA